jgi:hypothetical protein
MLRKPATLLASVLALTLTVAACDDDNNTTGPTPEGPTFALRVVHASPDAPAVDIWAEGGDAPLFEDVSYGEATAYRDIPEGTYNIQIRAAGSAGSTTPVYETGDLTLSEDDKVTAVAAGFLASSNDEDKFRVLPLFEEFVSNGVDAVVRIVHASPDAPTVAIDVGNDGTPEIDSLARFADTGAAGVALPADEALQIGIWAGSPLQRVTAFTTPELPAGGELFVIATGSLAKLPREDDGFGLLAVAPIGELGIIRQNPTVYALHAGPDVGAADIFAGDLELVDNLSFADLSDNIQVPPGVYTLDFFAHTPGSVRPPGTPAASFDTPQLDAGERYVAVAAGFLNPDAPGEEPFQLLAYRDDFAFDALNTRARAVHASPDAPAVDIGTATGTQISAVVFSNLSFAQGSAGEGAAIPEASLRLGVAPTGDINTVATFDVTTVADLRAFTFAVGALSPDVGEEGFRLVLVNTSESPWAASEIAAN